MHKGAVTPGSKTIATNLYVDDHSLNNTPKSYEVVTEQDWRNAAEVLQVLRLNLDLESFTSDRTRLTAEGYQLIGVKVGEKMVAVASYVITPHPIQFRELQIHDMATLPQEQSKGYGGRLLAELEKVAVERKCGRIYVNSREDRSDAQRFYRCYGFKNYSVGFVKVLS